MLVVMALYDQATYAPRPPRLRRRRKNRRKKWRRKRRRTKRWRRHQGISKLEIYWI